MDLLEVLSDRNSFSLHKSLGVLPLGTNFSQPYSWHFTDDMMSEIEVKVKVIGQKAARMVKTPARTSIVGLLDKIEQNRETVVVRVNGKIIAEEELLANGDLVEILPIVTGG